MESHRILFCLSALVFADSVYGRVVDYPFVSRKDWGATEATETRPLNLPVPYVVVHHTYIPGVCRTTESCKADMRSMQRYHKSLGWDDIGYNFCVGGDGAAYEGRGWENVGIHAGPANSVSIGICIIGDWRVELPVEESLKTTKALIEDGINRGVISPSYKLIGHGQVMSTECPGTALQQEISTWNNYAAGPFKH